MSEAVAEAVAPAESVVMPESPMTPEIPTNKEQPEAQPAPEQPAPEATPEPTEIEIYQDIQAKYQDDNSYEMSDAEADAFNSVMDRVARKEIEEPKAQKLGEKPAEKPEKPAEKPEAKTEEQVPPESKEVEEPKFDGFSEDVSSSLMEAMKATGSKDLTQLGKNVKGLASKLGDHGNKFGNELAGYKEREANHIRFLDDLKAGKPGAQEYLEKITGKPTPQQQPKKQEEVEIAPEDILDDKLYAIVQKMKADFQATNDAQAKTIEQLQKGDQTRAETAQNQVAVDAWIDDVVDLVTSNSKDFGINPSEARGLAKEYWANDAHLNPIHPKFQKMHELIEFCSKEHMPTLKHAHTIWHHDKGHFAQKLVEATKEGQQANQHVESPNGFLSKKQGRHQPNIPQAHITDENVAEMEHGDGFKKIPDEWTDDLGNFIPEKIPERFHEKAFGRMGKPKR